MFDINIVTFVVFVSLQAVTNEMSCYITCKVVKLVSFRTNRLRLITSIHVVKGKITNYTKVYLGTS